MNAGHFPLIAIPMVCMDINISEITRVKVCGITTAEDCSLVVEAGADAIGFIFYKKSARFVETPKAREIMRDKDSEALSFIVRSAMNTVGVDVSSTTFKTVDVDLSYYGSKSSTAFKTVNVDLYKFKLEKEE